MDTIRKNIYCDKIIMISIEQILSMSQYDVPFIYEKVKKRLKKYFSLLKEQYEEQENFYDIKVGILLDDEVSVQMFQMFNYYNSEIFNSYIRLEYIMNAVLYSNIDKPNEEIYQTLERVFIDRLKLKYKEFEQIYGTDTLNYVLAHKDYDYITGIDPVIEGDKHIILLKNETLLMETTVLNEEEYTKKKVIK